MVTLVDGTLFHFVQIIDYGNDNEHSWCKFRSTAANAWRCKHIACSGVLKQVQNATRDIRVPAPTHDVTDQSSCRISYCELLRLPVPTRNHCSPCLPWLPQLVSVDYPSSSGDSANNRIRYLQSLARCSMF